MRVISGVFINETVKSVASDDELMVVQKKRAQAKHAQKMRQLLEKADTSGDSCIQRDEFTWLAAQEIDVGDADLLFDLMDGGDGELTSDELCTGISRLKGPAKSLDLIGLIHMTWNMSYQLNEVQQMLRKYKSEDTCTRKTEKMCTKAGGGNS